MKLLFSNFRKKASIKPIMNQQGMYCLNIGCGDHYFNDWVNLDIEQEANVQYCDINNKLPFGDNSFDLAYSSNVIEHLDRQCVVGFLSEVYRVLKPGGTVRILTPDFERMCREYLVNLEEWDKSGEEVCRLRYDWILLEIFDQMVRERPGGQMAEALRCGEVDREYVLRRTGDELMGYFSEGNHKILAEKNKNEGGFSVGKWHGVARKCKNAIKELLNRKKAYAVRKGERHKWYYDRVSLRFLLQKAGFVGCAIVDYRISRICNWGSMNLDKSRFRDAPRKPDSIIVEASKPSC